MITTTQMYWLTRLDGFKCVLEAPACVITAIAAIWAIAGIAHLLAAWEWHDEGDIRDAFRKLKIVGALSFVTFLLFTFSAFIPSTREMAAIIIVPKIANSEKVQQVGNKLYDLAVEWMGALKPNKDNSKEISR